MYVNGLERCRLMGASCSNKNVEDCPVYWVSMYIFPLTLCKFMCL